MYGKSEDREDYQDLPRPLAAMARDLPDGHRITAHRHRRVQLIYGVSGAITVVADAGTWVVPPVYGVVVPAGMEHAMHCTGQVRMRTVYIEPGAVPGLPADPAVVEVSPLLRELIEEAARIPAEYAPGGRDDSVMGLLLRELDVRPVRGPYLPAPSDPELAALCAEIHADPGRHWTTPSVAAHAHLSPRTVQRRFVAATGMTLSQWVQMSCLLHAVALLARGEPVTSIAAGLGYATPSAFTAMFRRVLGVAPSGYLAGPRTTGPDA